eukprot:GFYU01009190.1.p1 GENE.GFYU01009190.1~~GFYU01009190.1.p1  ORF type:complete len:213 (+),score=45.63 GFYU01009190.1:77-640(+)
MDFQTHTPSAFPPGGMTTANPESVWSYKFEAYGKFKGSGFKTRLCAFARQRNISGTVEGTKRGTVVGTCCGRSESLVEFEQFMKSDPNVIKVDVDHVQTNLPDLPDTAKSFYILNRRKEKKADLAVFRSIEAQQNAEGEASDTSPDDQPPRESSTANGSGKKTRFVDMNQFKSVDLSSMPSYSTAQT